MLNKVQLIGNIGRNPTTRSSGGTRAATATLATRRRWKKREGERQEDTQWHRLVFWGWQADLAEELLKKGQLVYVEGRLNTTSWPDPEDDGHTNFRTEVVAESFLILSPKNHPSHDAKIE